MIFRAWNLLPTNVNHGKWMAYRKSQYVWTKINMWQPSFMFLWLWKRNIELLLETFQLPIFKQKLTWDTELYTLRMTIIIIIILMVLYMTKRPHIHLAYHHVATTLFIRENMGKIVVTLYKDLQYGNDNCVAVRTTVWNKAWMNEVVVVIVARSFPSRKLSGVEDPLPKK